MSREPSDAQQLRARVCNEIVAHNQVYGRTRWNLIRERPEFAHAIGKAAGKSGERKFRRWVQEMTKPVAASDNRPLAIEAAAAEAMDEATKRAQLAVFKNVPAPPSPAIMLRDGRGADQRINLFGELLAIREDVFALRNSAIDGDGGIQDAKIFERAISRHLDVVCTYLRTQQEVYDLAYQQRFYDLIVEVIVEDCADDPARQKRITGKLEALNAEEGMTPYRPTAA